MNKLREFGLGYLIGDKIMIKTHVIYMQSPITKMVKMVIFNNIKLYGLPLIFGHKVLKIHVDELV